MIYGSYYSPMMADKYYAYEPVTPIGPKEKPKSNTGAIIGGVAAGVGILATVKAVKQGKLNGAKKTITDLFTKAKTNVKNYVNKDKIENYAQATKKFFTEGKGKKIFTPVKDAYQYAATKIKNIIAKDGVVKNVAKNVASVDPFAKMPKFNPFEYTAGGFNKFV